MPFGIPGETLSILRMAFWTKLGRFDRALAILDATLARGPRGNLHLNRAQLLELLGRREEAVESYRAALRRDPENLETRLAVTETLFAWGWERQRVLAFVAGSESLSGREERVGPGAP